jgi:hypothetical protein
MIGGLDINDGNVIVFNPTNRAGTHQQPAAGVWDTGFTARNTIAGNSITGNGGLGIDLHAAGVTPNDTGDSDGIQNFPILTSAAFSNDTVRVTGLVNSRANTSFRIEIFGSENVGPSAYPQGQFFLGFVNVITDAAGNASFDMTLEVSQSVTVITATTTGPTVIGGTATSEFSAPLFAKVVDLATRAAVRTDDEVVIAGFIVSGPDAKKVLLRGIGPSMSVGGVPVPGRLEDPVIALYSSSGTLMASNNDWQDSQKAEIEATGLAPSASAEAALLVTLAPAAYTVQLSGLNRSTGIGLAEVYDLAPKDSHLANISARARVGDGDDVTIGGFVVGGENSGRARILIRGLGPSLAVPKPLPDPVIEVRDRNGAILASNDNWRTNEAQVASTGIPPADDRESALVVTLPTDGYTAILRGANSGTGVGVIEIYHL